MIKNLIYWLWIIIASLDIVGGIGAGLIWWKEERDERLSSARRMAHILFSGGYRSATTVVGLALFGLNLRSKTWFLCVGLSAVAYKAYSTWSWVLMSIGVINGGGWLGLLRSGKEHSAKGKEV